MPSSTHWEFPSYEIEDVTPGDVKCAHRNAVTSDSPPSFTHSLWKAILVSKDVSWVRRSGAIPEGDAWDQWLRLAERNALDDNREWDAVEMRETLVRASRGRL